MPFRAWRGISLLCSFLGSSTSHVEFFENIPARKTYVGLIDPFVRLGEVFRCRCRNRNRTFPLIDNSIMS